MSPWQYTIFIVYKIKCCLIDWHFVFICYNTSGWKTLNWVFISENFETPCLSHLYTYPTMKMEQTECSKTLTCKIQTPGIFFLLWCCGPTRAMASSFLRFLDPLDKWSARRRDLYLTTHNSHNRQTSMPPGGIRTHDFSRRGTADLRLRPRGYWEGRRRGITQKKAYNISYKHRGTRTDDCTMTTLDC